MPRITAALAIVATVTFCIGFNIVRYPVVWEMLADSPGVARASPAAAGASGTDTTAKTGGSSVKMAAKPIAITDAPASPEKTAQKPAEKSVPAAKAAGANEKAAATEKRPATETMAAVSDGKSAAKKPGAGKKHDAKPDSAKSARDDDKDKRAPKPVIKPVAITQPSDNASAGDRPRAAEKNVDPNRISAGPMVPVNLPPRRSPANHSADGRLAQNSRAERAVRRLPPIDPLGPALTQRDLLREGGVVFYPTTGIR